MPKPKDGHLHSRTKTGSATRAATEAVIRNVVEAHETLSLDNKADRETLIAALTEAMSS